MIDGRHVFSSVLDVHTFRDPNIDSDRYRRSLSNLSDIGRLLANISHSFRTIAETVLGFERPPQRIQWCDEGCHETAAAKNATYRKTLQSSTKRAIVENYGERRRDETHFQT